LLIVLALAACKKDEQPTPVQEAAVEQPPETEPPQSKTSLFPGEDVLAVQAQIEEEFGPMEVRQIINSLPPFEIELVGLGEDFVAFDSVEDFAEYGMDQRGTVVKSVASSSEDYKSHAQFIRLMREISTPMQEVYFGSGPVESVRIIAFMDNDERRTPMPGWKFVEFRLKKGSSPPTLVDFKSNSYKPRGKAPLVVFEVPEDAVSETFRLEVGAFTLTFKFADLVTHRLLKSPDFLTPQ